MLPALKFLFSFWLFSKAFFLTPLASFFLTPGMMQLPKPSGPHVVGTTAFKVVDATRTNSPFSDDQRTFLIYCWYPATHETAHTLAYLADNAKPLKREFYKNTQLPTAVIDSIFAVKTHAYLKAPAKTLVAPFPVVVLSHGLAGFGLLHCALAENLASRGYFVVGIDHTHFSTVSVIDGESIWQHPSIEALFRSKIPHTDIFKRTAQLFQLPVGDIKATLDYIENIDFPLDLSRIGLVGHSMGGISSIEVARTDKRCKAVVSLDGWFPAMNSTQAIGKPAMILFSDKEKLNLLHDTDFTKCFKPAELATYYNLLETQAQTFIRNNGNDSYFVTIPGASHLAFCDFILLRWPLTNVIPAREAGLLSGQNPYPIIQRMNMLVRKFFDKYIKQ